MFLKPEDVEKVRVGSLLSLVDNAGLGLVFNLVNQRGDTVQQ
jgi:nucleoside diphosphate kinase